MIDVVQIQDDLVGVLGSYDGLASVNIKSYRRMRMENEINFRTIVETKRAGKCGAGVLVCQPLATNPRPGVTGPVLGWTFPVIVIEQADINMHPQVGTLLSAEEIAQFVLDAVHLHADVRYGTLAAAANAIAEEKEFVFDGCIGYRLNFNLTAGKTTQTARLGPVTISVATGACTLTGPTGAQVWYTTDGSYPGRDVAGNAASHLYSGAFAVSSGDKVRAAAYMDGYNQGAVGYQAVT